MELDNVVVDHAFEYLHFIGLEVFCSLQFAAIDDFDGKLFASFILAKIHSPVRATAKF